MVSVSAMLSLIAVRLMVVGSTALRFAIEERKNSADSSGGCRFVTRDGLSPT